MVRARRAAAPDCLLVIGFLAVVAFLLGTTFKALWNLFWDF